MRIFFVLLAFSLHFVNAIPAGGKCETTADCVAPNVCSKWGWCQWTKIYGEDGPSQGASAPGGGRAGQCKTSADCASRVPYCSKLGYCHGGRLPFDEEQIEITGAKDAQGFINNNPARNSPALAAAKSPSSNGSGGNDATPRSKNSPGQSGKSGGNAANLRRNPGTSSTANQSGKSEGCPGGSVEACIENACVPLKEVQAYGICVNECGKRCPE